VARYWLPERGPVLSRTALEEFAFLVERAVGRTLSAADQESC
jgi:hypothetical protein